MNTRIKKIRQIEQHEVEASPSADYLVKAARMEAVIDAQPDCVKVVAKDYTLMDMNFTGLDMIGAASIEMVRGVKVLGLIDPEYHDIYKNSVDQAYKGIGMEIEFAITGLNGIKRFMSQRSAPIYSSNDPNKVVEMVAVARDITRKRDNILALERAKGVAEEASRVKSNFLATMSHEFRTPLNAILGFSEIIKAESFGKIGNAKYAEYINDIHSSGRHLLDLINDVLDISEIEADKRVLLKEELDLEEVALHCLSTVNILAEKKQIMISVNIGANLPKIYGDRRSLKQILINLLSNSIKFSHEEGVVILSIFDDGNNVKIAIKDNGIGIADTDIADITKPFFRGQSEADIAVPGTGLGLSIVKSLVDAHGGDLKIESKEHIGTVVKLDFPIHSPE